MRPRVLVVVLSLAAQALAAQALAQPAPSASASASAQAGPSQDDRDRARALMDAGDEKIEKGDAASALDAYEKAHAIMGVPTTGIEVAKTLEKLGRLTAALAAARGVAAMPVTAGEPKPFAAAREQAQKLATALEARVPTLAISVTIATAEVSIDGRKLSAEERRAPLALEPGRYKVRAVAEGYVPTTVELTLKEGDRAQAALALSKEAIEPLPKRPTPPPPPPVTLSPFVPIGFSVAGLGAVAGAITGVLAISAANEASTLCNRGVCPSEAVRQKAQGRYDTADALAVASDVSFVLAIAGVGLGIYGIAVTVPAAPSSQPGKAALVVGPGSISVRGSF